LACDDVQIATLNAEFREKPTPTNVLSWPAEDLAAETDGASPTLPHPDITGEVSLGDIAISYDTCAREAADAGKSLAEHTTHLIVHGLLHLLGYDHVRDRDATLMEETEVKILGTLGIDDPYSLD
jgi:probable rRNA maturation factor